MKYEFSVKYNGVIYKAGEDVPDGAFLTAKDNKPKNDTPVVETTVKEEKPKSSKTKATK